MTIIVNGKRINLPDFLIIGSSRSGTSSLYFYLREHPEIFMPEEKEPHFFNLPESWAIEDYAKLFQSGSENQILGEATATYLYYYEKSIKNIKLIYGSKHQKLKLIAILRNPIDRAWSYYLLKRRGGYKKDFFEMLNQLKEKKDRIVYDDFISSGMYYKQVEAFYKHFSFIKIVLFEEFVNHPVQVLKQIYEFLDLNNCDFLPDNLDEIYNVSGEPRINIYRPVYNFLFKDNKLKDLLKPMISYNSRQKVKTKIANWIIEKPDMPNAVRRYLSNTFIEDLNLLLRLFNNEEQVKIINNWIEVKNAC